MLDGGACQVGLESTIVDTTGPIPSVLRPGGVTREQIEAALGQPLAEDASGRIRVPGQHPSHYAPRARVMLVGVEKLLLETRLAQEHGHRVGVLLPHAHRDAQITAHAVVTLPVSLAHYARGLYRHLRELDNQGCDLIIATLPEPQGLGAAIANRLRRAAGPREAD